ncbi:MAG: glycoside hydrolase family 172 protein [Planctomycetota bacterium]
MKHFNGLGMSLGDLSRLSNAKTRSISAENPTGEKGKGALAEADPNGPARELGRGWKCRPCIKIKAGEEYVLADIEGPGAIQSMWFAGYVGRNFILRIYWEDQAQPSVECPLPDFFALPWVHERTARGPVGPEVAINSVPVAVCPAKGLNCFWEMPFRKRCRITMQNIAPQDIAGCFHQINYTLTEVPDDCAYFHAQFRRTNPLPYGEVYTILDAVKGRGHYVGTSMGWGINNTGWWGEGEIKFYIDGDDEFPTICGTGTEDYFGGSYDWDVDGKYVTYTTPFLGMHQVIRPDGHYSSQHRHAMYRWHVMDPVRFERDIRVTIQALGWRSGGRFLPGQHDICSVAYWYQALPTAAFAKLPNRDALEIV